MSATHTLAEFVARTPFTAIPASTIHAAKRAILDNLGAALGAAADPAVAMARRVVQQLGGQPQATLWADGQQTSVTHAALVNGIMAHVLDYDDTHLPTILHPSSPLVAAALAVGEWLGASGQDLLTAYLVGFEVEARVSLSVYPEHYDAGWHITGTAGTLGAAAAAARLLGLDPPRTLWALGAAATQAAGLREMFGSMCKSLHAGKAAANGILAALLAHEGYTSSPTPLEGRRGFGHVLSTRFAAEALTAELGQRWEVHRTGFKPYACGVVTHPAIDAARRLRAMGHSAEAVASIDVYVHPLVLELCGKSEPRTGLEGKFSIYHCVAVGFLEDAAGPAQFTDTVVARPDVVALRRKVRAVPDPALREAQARLVLHTADGRTTEVFVPAASGTLENPMTDADVEAKFRALARPAIGERPTETVANLVWALESVPDVRTLARALGPRPLA
ncbi:MAG TPA: MmgE/PrpD family protein [Chloroflexota bacterium]|nr:MmgE/PrpD family protein [Chloroflexota bacterium]HZU06868.1 MmgE/PrpD family protein [Chloroflexota bacterium]